MSVISQAIILLKLLLYILISHSHRVIAMGVESLHLLPTLLHGFEKCSDCREYFLDCAMVAICSLTFKLFSDFKEGV